MRGVALEEAIEKLAKDAALSEAEIMEEEMVCPEKDLHILL